MAVNYKSNLYALNQGLSTYSYIGPYGTRSGETVTLNGSVTPSATALATGDFGDIAPIPPGAKIISAIVFTDGGGTIVTTTLELGTDDLKASMALAPLPGAIELTGVECAASWATNASAEALLRFAYTSVSGPAACVHQFAITYAMP